MFRRFNLKLLTGVLLLLVVIAVTVKLVQSHKGDSSFRMDLFTFDTSGISSISIAEGLEKEKSVVLEKNNKGWVVKKGNESFRANTPQVEGLLDQLSVLKPERVVAKSRDKWKEFQVDDSTGVFVSLKKGDKTIKTFVIGKFNWQQPTNPYDRQGTITSYLREGKETETFAVSGFLRMSFSTDASVYRDKTITFLKKENISGITFSYPDSSFTIDKVNSLWMINASIPADSLSTEKFLDDMMRISGNEFSANIPAGMQPVFSLKVNALASPVQIDAFKTDSTSQFILHSSQNQDNYFKADKELMQRIFKGLSYFRPGKKK